MVEVRGISAPLEGDVRGAEHFRGVATVVTKLFNMVQPDDAFFGQKDAQQALLIRRMVRDLDVPVRMEVCPTVREPDGLAMSSRNVLLTPDDRAPRAGARIARCAAVDRCRRVGRARSGRALAVPAPTCSPSAGIEPEYFAAVSTDTLEPVRTITGETLIAFAARFGEVRLIDNVLVDRRDARLVTRCRAGAAALPTLAALQRARQADRDAHRVRLSVGARSPRMAGVDVVLVGDSAAMTVLGYDHDARHLGGRAAGAHARGAPRRDRRSPSLATCPSAATRRATRSAVATARRFVDEAGCDAVKLEGADGDAFTRRARSSRPAFR